MIGSSSLTSTLTVGLSGFSPASDCSRSIRSAGRISAPSTSPDSTFSRASSSLETGTHSIRSQSSLLAPSRSKSSPPICSGVSGGTSLRKATRGFSGPALSAKPIRTAITIG